MVIYWRRLDLDGLERLRIHVGEDEVRASSTVLCVEEGGFRIDYDWLLDGDWTTRRLVVRRHGEDGVRELTVEHRRGGWSTDGIDRPDLDGATEADLSVTPFCNTLPIRRLPDGAGSELTLDTVYVDGRDLSVVRSRQRYIRRGADTVRYVDLGSARGFEADLVVDADAIVERYEGLFERIRPPQ